MTNEAGIAFVSGAAAAVGSSVVKVFCLFRVLICGPVCASVTDILTHMAAEVDCSSTQIFNLAGKGGGGQSWYGSRGHVQK